MKRFNRFKGFTFGETNDSFKDVNNSADIEHDFEMYNRRFRTKKQKKDSIHTDEEQEQDEENYGTLMNLIQQCDEQQENQKQKETEIQQEDQTQQQEIEIQQQEIEIQQEIDIQQENKPIKHQPSSETLLLDDTTSGEMSEFAEYELTQGSYYDPILKYDDYCEEVQRQIYNTNQIVSILYSSLLDLN